MEAGKKYQNKHTGTIYECLIVEGAWVVLRAKGQIPFVTESRGCPYEEYHEPKIESAEYAAFYYDEKGVFLAGRPGGTYPGAENIGAIRITSTDGKLTSVEIIKEP